MVLLITLLNNYVFALVLILCCFFSADLQQFLSCGSLFWILGQGQLDKMVEVICPVGSELGENEKNK